jgi:rubrerythrin
LLENHRPEIDIHSLPPRQKKRASNRLLPYFWTLPTIKLLEGGEAEVFAHFPAGVIADTAANLKGSAKGERYEYAEMYPSFAEIAMSEGFPEIAKTFLNIAAAERGHERRYLSLKKNLDEGIVFKRDGTVVWRCRNCGYLHEGNAAPEECPACKHEQAYFEVFGEVY